MIMFLPVYKPFGYLNQKVSRTPNSQSLARYGRLPRFHDPPAWMNQHRSFFRRWHHVVLKQRTPTAPASLPELGDAASSMDITATAADLISRAASHSITPPSLPHHLDGRSWAQLLQTLHHSLGTPLSQELPVPQCPILPPLTCISGTNTAYLGSHAATGGAAVADLAHGVHISSALSGAGSLQQAVLPTAVPAWPPLDLASASATGSASTLASLPIDGTAAMHTAAAADYDTAGSVLSTAAATNAMAATATTATAAAATAATAAGLPGMEGNLNALTFWATDKLAVVQSIDQAAHDTMRTSLHSLLGGMRDVTAEYSSHHTMQWTNALVLGVQQLVTTLRLPSMAGGSGSSVGAMVAAQEAMSATLTTTPVGLDALLNFILGIIAATIASIPRDDWLKRMHTSADKARPGADLPLEYDPDLLSAYFARHPAKVMHRNADVVSKFSAIGVALLSDWKLGKWEANMPERAAWVRRTVEGLGAAYIKIAQAASTRVDMVPQPYLDEFAKLQDSVPPFSTVEARRVLEQGLQRPVDEVFEWLSEEPLAAASLGQVYRGKLRQEHGGVEVAVKVQRPGVLEAAALDIFIMRRSALLFSKMPGMSEQWAGVLDDWALRFFQEMDYQREAQHTMAFKHHMAGLQGIRIATVYPALVSRKILVTEWIEGEKLGESSSEDVRALCSTLLNCYLIQLLETGLLHADPHPGNLMRTPDGKIVILDFGLMTEVSEDQRIGLVEYIAHLTMEDWDALSADLVKLGFLPTGLSSQDMAAIVPVMQNVMSQIFRGGGIRNGISMTGLAFQLEGVAKEFKMCLPPYFALVLRAFSVIEGIALQADPNFAIVHECLPYLSRRLLSDNNPRMRAALHQLLYGKSTRLDIQRLQRLMSAFTSFTTAALPSASGPTFSAAVNGNSHAIFGQPGGSSTDAGASSAGAQSRGSAADGSTQATSSGAKGPVLNESIKEALRMVFAKDGSYAQEIIVDELVAAVDAMSREALSEALHMVVSSATLVAGLRSTEALGPLRAMLLPVPLPTDMLSSMQPSLTLTLEDRQALNTVRTVLELMQSSMSHVPSVAHAGSRALRAAGEVVPMLPELLPGMQGTLELFIRQLVRRMATRLAEDLEPGRPPVPEPTSHGHASSSSSSQAAAPANNAPPHEAAV